MFLLVEGASFGAAASADFGLIFQGHQHRPAAIAESVIASVLVAGFAFSFVLPRKTRGLGFVAQAFALLGTLVGLFTIAIGIGPHTVPDLTFHFAILVVLGWGVVVAARRLGGVTK